MVLITFFVRIINEISLLMVISCFTICFYIKSILCSIRSYIPYVYKEKIRCIRLNLNKNDDEF